MPIQGHFKHQQPLRMVLVLKCYNFLLGGNIKIPKHVYVSSIFFYIQKLLLLVSSYWVDFIAAIFCFICDPKIYGLLHFCYRPSVVKKWVPRYPYSVWLEVWKSVNVSCSNLFLSRYSRLFDLSLKVNIRR